MRRKFPIFIVIFISLLFGGILNYPAIGEAKDQVVVIKIRDEIDASQAALVHRALTDTKVKDANTILIEIDTFGGLVDSAVKIRDMISDSDKQTICYIKNRAWSAGALIAIAHKHIAIAPGGSIGAAEPIPTTEKTVAALKAEFAATANKTGRNPKVAEAMVDKSLGFPGFAEPGKILALTENQAVEVGYADVVAANREAVLSYYGLSDAEIIEYDRGLTEKITGWLSDPAIKSILLTIVFLAVLTEIKTAGIGAAATIGLISAALFFGSQWLAGMAGWLELLLFFGGILLIIFELHVPGVGLFGLAGVVSILASIFLTLGGDLPALNILAGSLVLAVLLFLLILKYLPSSGLWHKLILKDAENTKDGFVSGQDYNRYLGQKGVVISILRPAGTIEIEEVHLDVISEGQYVEAGRWVKVVNINGTRIVVQPVKE